MSLLKKFKEKSTEPDDKGVLHLGGEKLEKELGRNIEIIEQIFKDDETLIKREFENQKDNKVKCCALFFDGMIDNRIINESVIQPIIANTGLSKNDETIDEILSQVIATNSVEKSGNLDEISQGLLHGDTVLLVDGSSSAIIINTKGWQTRAITEPDNEKGLRGPREGFTEALLINLSLIRRKILTPDLKFKFRTFGTRSNTKACICYLDSLVDKKVLDELNRRLDKIEIDGVLDINYIVELIKDSQMSPFKTIGVSERPDVIASKLLEGRVAIILDGTPVVLTVPYLFIENFQANDDYYLNFYFASIGRFLRILGFLMTISIPAVYMSFTTYHREMIPTDLALSIMEAHQGVPFPTIVECVIMLVLFEIIRETGLRMPTNIGQALSIVGALVIGQAAVDAKFISAPMVIVVAVTAITGLINPKVKGAVVILRFLFLFASAMLGIYGYAFACIGLLIHLFSMKSFGVIYTSQISSYKFQEFKDNVFRASWEYMITRPIFVKKNIVRKK